MTLGGNCIRNAKFMVAEGLIIAQVRRPEFLARNKEILY